MSDTLAKDLIGKSFPQVALQSTEGKQVTLPKDLAGRWTVLYFYPKDDTPGCTKQACSYRDNIGEFEKIGVRVLGVSADDLASHGAFQEKYHLNFPLLADTEKKLAEALSVRSRDTFLIDPKGAIRKVWRKVDPTTTMGETYEAVTELMKG